MRRGNLLAGSGPQQPAEQVERLIDGPTARIERIVSTGQASPSGFWYDQPDHEFVVLLSGCSPAAIRERRSQPRLEARRLDRDPGGSAPWGRMDASRPADRMARRPSRRLESFRLILNGNPNSSG